MDNKGYTQLARFTDNNAKLKEILDQVPEKSQKSINQIKGCCHKYQNSRLTIKRTPKISYDHDDSKISSSVE